MKHLLLLLAICTSVVVGCNNTEQNNGDQENDNSGSQPDEAENIKITDWPGVYKGITPCADCEGIETTLILQRDSTFTLKMLYIDKSTEGIKKTGRITWNKKGNTIILEGIKDGASQYLVGENKLTQLDLNGQPVSGDLAENYVLKKEPEIKATNTDSSGMLTSKSIRAVSGLTGIKWKLVEILGRPVDDITGEKQDSYFILNDSDGKVSGFGGCNNFSGKFEIKANNRIQFTQMLSTLKACLDMQTETEFLDVFNRVDNYTIKNGILSFNKAKMATLARFEAIK